MIKIIGLAGKVGSGKSFIGEYISRETGFPLIKLDYQVAKVVNKPILKQLFQRRIRTKIPKAYADIQLFPLWKNLEHDFSVFEDWLVMSSLNRKLNRIVRKANQSIIVDFTILPALKASRKLDEMFCVKSDEQARLERLAKRDNLTHEQVQKVDKFMTKYYQKSYYGAFDGVIDNCYGEIPVAVVELVERLKTSC